MTKISYAGYRFPPEIMQQAISLHLWTVPRCNGFFSDLAKSVAAIYSVFSATSLLTSMKYADWRPAASAEAA
jgi:hypothetical protein